MIKCSLRQWKYYKTEFNLVLKDKFEVMTFINGDQDIINIKLKVAELKHKINYIEGIINTLNQMSFNIGNAIKFTMFKAGGA